MGVTRLGGLFQSQSIEEKLEDLGVTGVHDQGTHRAGARLDRPDDIEPHMAARVTECGMAPLRGPLPTGTGIASAFVAKEDPRLEVLQQSAKLG